MRLSFLEIYNENLYDLLATLPEFGPRTELSLLSDGRSGVPVKGLTAAEVRRVSAEDHLCLSYASQDRPSLPSAAALAASALS